jgi:heme d1 biosynthesis radical SAM protein NirJ
MFRVTQFMHEIVAPTPGTERRRPPGPVVIWNLIRRCNLTCRHCYAFSADHEYPGELDTREVFGVMDDLKAFRVPVLVLSGGEPLLRPDIDEIAARAKSLGFYVGLSTNGTLIDDATANRIAALGLDYVGISLDGKRATHDAFRRRVGAFDASLAAIRRCRDRGIRVGLRSTLTEATAADLPWLLELLETEGIDKFYLSHLNYAGRGNVHRRDDAFFGTTREAMTRLFDFAWERVRSGASMEVVTGNNDADGVFFLHWAQAHHPEAVEHLRAKLVQWGGNASGVNIANIDNLGNVHPDTYWWDYDLGNVRQRPFSEIWRDLSDPILAGLRAEPRRLGGRCGTCPSADICGGNTRTRARQLTGDPWQEDPGCYLDDDELATGTAAKRIALSEVGS